MVSLELLELLELDSSPVEELLEDSLPVVVSVSPEVGPDVLPPVVVSLSLSPVVGLPEVSASVVAPPELSATPVELWPVPDWLPPEVDMVSMSIGAPVELLPAESASVSESNTTEGEPQADAVIKANPSKKPLRILTAYRNFDAVERPAPKKNDRPSVRHPTLVHPTGEGDDDMTLYHLEYCPFCIDVRRSAEALGIELQLVDIGQNPEARAMLMERRGRGTVPVLGISSDDGERLMGESRDIIQYLRGLAAA